MAPDYRTIPARPDLAAAHLKGQVTAAQYVSGTPFTVGEPVIPLTGEPGALAGLQTQLLFGETFTVYEVREGWAWGQNGTDDYVGWVPHGALVPPRPAPAHRICVPYAPVFSAPDIKSRTLTSLPLNAAITANAHPGDFLTLETGYVWANHVAPRSDGGDLDRILTLARSFIGTPYLWGGRSWLGIDCSGLVQMVWAAAGIHLPRDSDQQLAALSGAIELAQAQPGDLIFWQGHVGLVSAPDRLLHANAHHMATVEEPLAPALARIAPIAGPVTGLRRLPWNG